MRKKLIFCGAVLFALLLTGGTFAFGYTNSSTSLNVSMADGAWASYQASPVQPDWNSVLPVSGNSSEILVPNGDGDNTAVASQYPDTGSHWNKVSDQPADDSATYISTNGSGNWQEDLYQLSDPVTPRTKINSVTVYVRFATSGTYTVQAIPELKTYGQVFSGPTQQTSDQNFQTISWESDINPSTGQAWISDELTSLQAGVQLKGSQTDKPAYCTQVYVQVNYTISGVAQGDVPSGNIYEVNPTDHYSGDMMVKIYLTNTATLLKAYQYINVKVSVSNSIEAGQTPGYKVLSTDNGEVEFTITGGSASVYHVSIMGGSYKLVSADPTTWESGYSLTPEFYCEITQR